MKANKNFKIEDQFDSYVVTTETWPEFAKELIAEGYQWSGHSPIEESVIKNHGAAKLISNPDGCVAWLYDRENKLVCVQSISTLHDSPKQKNKSVVDDIATIFNRK